jgi:hypothetical protein
MPRKRSGAVAREKRHYIHLKTLQEKIILEIYDSKEMKNSLEQLINQYIVVAETKINKY